MFLVRTRYQSITAKKTLSLTANTQSGKNVYTFTVMQLHRNTRCLTLEIRCFAFYLMTLHDVLSCVTKVLNGLIMTFGHKYVKTLWLYLSWAYKIYHAQNQKGRRRQWRRAPENTRTVVYNTSHSNYHSLNFWFQTATIDISKRGSAILRNPGSLRPTLQISHVLFRWACTWYSNLASWQAM